ncbi:MAG: sulfatase-like hydrolase/transferase, partial [Planctomycetes bacterium]|nr:sulfatase-like hydrolase/transferase [Planctomycetota bacterium]
MALAAGAIGLTLFRGWGEAGAERRPILLLTLDTLRADAAGRGKGTPAIERFLTNEATHFARARTVVPLTLPSHLSLLSGLYPARHGVHENVAPTIPPPAEREYRLLAEEFSEANYATGAFIARGVLAPETGIGAGFESYDSPQEQGIGEGDGEYRAAEEQVRLALAWLARQSPDRPWFLWVHLFDPHKPYHPYPGDAERAATGPGAGNRALYEGEVRRIDAAVERSSPPRAKEAIIISRFG